MLQSLVYQSRVLVQRSLQRYTKFLIVGGSNAIVDLFVLNVCILFSPWQTSEAMFTFNTLAVIAAIVNSYVWNRRWTFSDASDGSRRERWMFVLQALVNVVLNDLIVVILSAYLRFSQDIPLFVSSNAAKGLAMLLSSTASYFLMRFFVFRKPRQL